MEVQYQEWELADRKRNLHELTEVSHNLLDYLRQNYELEEPFIPEGGTTILRFYLKKGAQRAAFQIDRSPWGLNCRVIRFYGVENGFEWRTSEEDDCFFIGMDYYTRQQINELDLNRIERIIKNEFTE